MLHMPCTQSRTDLNSPAKRTRLILPICVQVAAQRKLLRCGVCDARQKDCIITKCWHLFCQQCIQKNLETRHRKCPGCGAAFGAADVKQVYLA